MDSRLLFEIIEPSQITSAIIVNSPHSGASYPQEFLNQTVLSKAQLQRGEDTAVDELFHPSVPFGACFMRAFFPRSFVDVNREPYELDPRMFEGKLPGFANTRSLRVAGGLGSIPRIIGDNVELYHSKMSVEDGMERIQTYYKPYHQALRQLLLKTQHKMGFSILLDCHSMPALSVKTDRSIRTDIVLGDRYGTSCNPSLIALFETSARRYGYNVMRNAPYAGGYITEHYGQPDRHSHALQIEVNRALYMDEKTLQRTDGFKKLQTDLMHIIKEITVLTAYDLKPLRNAAE